MPYMKVSISKTLTEEERIAISKELSKSLGLIPGKQPEFLISDIEDGRNMYLGGVRQENFAFIDVRYYSKFEYHIKAQFTESVFAALNKHLGFEYHQMFLTIQEFTSWGGFGNFIDEYYIDSAVQTNSST
jgi:hypothetical protein